MRACSGPCTLRQDPICVFVLPTRPAWARTDLWPLGSIEQQAASAIPRLYTVDTGVLTEPEAYELVRAIAMFPDVLEEAFERYVRMTASLAARSLAASRRPRAVGSVCAAFCSREPSTLVRYLFTLAQAATQAAGALRIKGQPERLAQPRLVALHSARVTLANGLRILGIPPVVRL